MFQAGTKSSLPTDERPSFRPQKADRPAIVVAPTADGAGDFGPERERSAYRPSTRSHPIAMIASALIVGGLIAALALMKVVPTTRTRHDLVMMNLAITPPPPPPRQPPAPRTHHDDVTPRRTAIVAPVPIVAVPAIPVVATAPQPEPQPVIQAPAAPTAPAPAAAPAVANAGDLSSTMISAKPPTYPLESRRRHEQGTVVLKLLLATDGLVSDVSLEKSSGSDRLDQAALSAVRKWRWKPVVRNGAPVLVQGLVTIPFVLAG